MLDALTPLDGRYLAKTSDLRKFLSEQAFIAYRLHVEMRWLLHLLACQERGDLDLKRRVSDMQKSHLRTLADCVLTDSTFAERAKHFEKQTNHDVKAVEYTLSEHLRSEGFDDSLLSLLHFACTSEDINNVAYALMLRDAVQHCMQPRISKLISQLKKEAHRYAKLPMLSRTHGQKATPTTLGKEFAVFVYRLQNSAHKISSIQLSAKMNGATGNYNAHYAVFPDTAWEDLARDFVTRELGLAFNPLSTQIESHDSLVELLLHMSHFATIAIGLCRDLWGYVSLGYLKQKMKANEVGSSTMPHKVNPIDFENAEGNFGLVCSLAQHMATKLPISRFQRDLSDSTVLRSLGSVFGYFQLALESLQLGLAKIEADENVIAHELDGSWELLGEALQTALRASGVADAYERIKKRTRGQVLTRDQYWALLDESTELDEHLRTRLRKLTPRTYLGYAAELVLKSV